MKAKLCLPARFEECEFDAYGELNAAAVDGVIAEVYGGLAPGPFGSGRASASLPRVDPWRLKDYVAEGRRRGYRFNYALNGSCFGGVEFTGEGRTALLKYVELLAGLGIDLITIALPSLIHLVAAHFPGIEVAASTILRVDSPSKAKRIEELGARRIILFEDVNRDFPTLRAIRAACSVKLEVMVNSPCLFGCPFREYHYTLQAHAHRGAEGEEGFEDWMVVCNLRKLEFPAELIRARGLIRPEDLGHYERLGIDYFKLVGRERDTAGNGFSRAAAYLKRSFDGNVFDLLPRPQTACQAYSLDNRELDGFIDFFLNRRNPCTTGCLACGHCDAYAQRIRPTVPADALRESVAGIRHRVESYIGRAEI